MNNTHSPNDAKGAPNIPQLSKIKLFADNYGWVTQYEGKARMYWPTFAKAHRFAFGTDTVCAWCQKEFGFKAPSGTSHGICNRHKVEFWMSPMITAKALLEGGVK